MATVLNISLFFSREPNCIFKSYLKVLCIETSTSLGYLRKFEESAEDFKGDLGSQLQLNTSRRRFQGSLGVPVPANFKPCTLISTLFNHFHSISLTFYKKVQTKQPNKQSICLFEQIKMNTHILQQGLKVEKKM